MLRQKGGSRGRFHLPHELSFAALDLPSTRSGPRREACGPGFLLPSELP